MELGVGSLSLPQKPLESMSMRVNLFVYMMGWQPIRLRLWLLNSDLRPDTDYEFEYVSNKYYHHKVICIFLLLIRASRFDTSIFFPWQTGFTKWFVGCVSFNIR